MIIGLTGYAQSGKDTVASYLSAFYDYKRVAFADNVRKFLYELDINETKHIVDSVGWDTAKKITIVRENLQKVGLTARKIMGEDIWISLALKNLNPKNNTVITDVRFKNEADAIRLLGGVIWRVERPGIGPVNDHVSERDMLDYDVDEVLINKGTVEDLAMLVRKHVGSIKHG